MIRSMLVLPALHAAIGCSGLASGGDVARPDGGAERGAEGAIFRETGPADVEPRDSAHSDVNYGPCIAADASSHNPGGCDSSCAGTCSSGRCVEKLVPAFSGFYNLAIDSTSVYWGAGDSVVKIAKSGGTPFTLASGAFSASTVSVNARAIYWVDSGCDARFGCEPFGSVMSAPLAGLQDGGAPTTLAQSQPALSGIALDTGNVFWMNGIPGAIMTESLEGGTPITVAAIPQRPLVAASFVVDDANIYWVAALDVMRAPAHPGGPVTAVTRGERAGQIAVSTTDVYWTNNEGFKNGSVRRVSKGGGAVAVVASNQDMTLGGSITVDATSVYWTTQGDCVSAGVCPGTVMKAPLCGGAPTTLSATQGGVAVAVDDSSVYWIDS
jgi:hypothetical protein